MTRSTDTELETLLGPNLLDCLERIPETPSPGNYVVVDVFYFSTTVVELLANGATHVHVTDERGEEFAYREKNPTARIGGSSTEDYEPEKGYDFYNSPSYVQSVDVEGRPVSMTSSNGGRAVSQLRTAAETVDLDVYVGGTTNADALATHLRATTDPTYLVAAGSDATPSTEDYVGAILVGRYLADVPPTPVERDRHRGLVVGAKNTDDLERSAVRRADVEEYATALDSRSVVPKLVGDRLVDVTRETTTVDDRTTVE
jgi:2-phosphosulfolactate phosphatase